MSRYLIGIDLGTTNCALAYVEEGKSSIIQMPISQEVSKGFFEEKPLLPSYCYLEDDRQVVGSYAKEMGSKVPTRLISSAKSWLCNSGAKRREKILPIDVFDLSRRISPVEATTLYLRHLIQSFNTQIAKNDPSKLFENQEIVITLPASFDQVARMLTLEACTAAGIKNPIFLEEPQAAFYSWIYFNQKTIKETFKDHQTILVVDIGGGTSDFSLIEVLPQGGFEREKVGKHLLLGGDNMDEALAHLIAQKMGGVDEKDWQRVKYLAKTAKEDLLTHKDSVSVVLTGHGTSVVKGSKSIILSRQEVCDFLLEGFFKVESFDNALRHEPTVGLQSMGLAYEKESSVIKHLAKFLGKNSKKPDFVLFNGGTLKPQIFRQKVLEALALWFDGKKPIELVSSCFDLAVSKGAAYFLKVQKGEGIKIQSRVPCSYFVQVEDKGQKKALALVPKGSDYGFEYELKDPFYITPNKPVEFSIYYSNTLLSIESGHFYSLNEEDFALLAPLKTVLKLGQKQDKIKVKLNCKLTHLGSLEIQLKAQDTPHSFLLEFTLQGEDQPLKEASKVTFTQSDSELFKSIFRQALTVEPKNYAKILEDKLNIEKNLWPVGLLRALFDELISLNGFMNKDPQRFWNLAGFLLRPGSGWALDEHRIKELWKRMLEDSSKPCSQDVMLQKWICFRRIALGLNKGSQIQIASLVYLNVIKVLEGKEVIKNRNDEYLFCEKLRLLASLELLELQNKIKLGHLLVKKIKTGKCKEVYIHALSRIGARYLLTRSITHVVPISIVTDWILELETFFKTEDQLGPYLLEHLCRKTDQRELNIAEDTIKHVINFYPENQRLAKLLLEVVPLSVQEEEAILGDSLPTGLQT
jgi:actin-like ATPase involved in cell morphogenesis